MLDALITIAMDAYFFGSESVLRQKQQNECLIANKCEAKYDSTTQAWIITSRTHFISKGKTYKTEECLSANTCHYDLKIQDYVAKPNSLK